MILRYYFCMTAETLSIIAEVSELTFSGHIRYFIYVVWIFSKMLSIDTESLKFENQISGSKLFSVNLFRTNSGLWFPFLFYSAQKIKFDVKYFFSTQFPLDCSYCSKKSLIVFLWGITSRWKMSNLLSC